MYRILTLVACTIVAAPLDVSAQNTLEFVQYLDEPPAREWFNVRALPALDSAEAAPLVVCRRQALALSPTGSEIAYADEHSIHVKPGFPSSDRRSFSCAPKAEQLHFTKDGAHLLLVTEGGDVLGYDVATGKQLWTASAGQKVAAVAVHPTLPWVSLGGEQGLLWVLNSETGVELARETREHWVHPHFLPKGDYLAAVYRGQIEFVPIKKEKLSWTKAKVRDSGGAFGRSCTLPGYNGVLTLSERSGVSLLSPKKKKAKSYTKKIEFLGKWIEASPMGIWTGRQLLDPKKKFKPSVTINSAKRGYARISHDGRYLYSWFPHDKPVGVKRYDLQLDAFRTGLVAHLLTTLQTGPDRDKIQWLDDERFECAVRVSCQVAGKKRTEKKTSSRIYEVSLSDTVEQKWSGDHSCAFSQQIIVEYTYKDSKLVGVQVTDRKTGKVRKAPLKDLYPFAWSANGRYFCVRDQANDRRKGIFDLQSQRVRWLSDDKMYPELVFDNGDWIGGHFTNGKSELVRRNLTTPEDTWRRASVGNNQHILCSPDRSTILVNGHVLDAATGETRFEVPLGENHFTSTNVLVSQTDNVRLYDIRTGKVTHSFPRVPKQQYVVSVSPSRKYIVMKDNKIGVCAMIYRLR